MDTVNADDTFFCAKHALSLIQTRLADLRSKATCAKTSQSLRAKATRIVAGYIRQLEDLLGAVRVFLLKLSGREDATAAAQCLLGKLQELAEDMPGLEAIEEGRSAELAAGVRQARVAKLEGDVASLRAAAAALPPGTPVRTAALEAVVRELGAREQSLGFHVRLAAEVGERFGSCGGSSGSSVAAGQPGNAADMHLDDAQAGTAEGQHPQHTAGAGSDKPVPYSLDNFAYGSTPYTTWLRVLSAAGPCLQSAMAGPDREYVVWGSSCGWLVLCGALTYGWRSRGVELLSCLHGVAQEVALQQAPALAGTAGVKFSCGDLLDDDVSSAGLVVLADQCWDTQLAQRAAAKLARQLPRGALCISYSGTALAAEAGKAVGKEGPGGGFGHAAGGAGRTFEEVATVRAPVSWADSVQFRVFRRV